jgi:hypothetical protein
MRAPYEGVFRDVHAVTGKMEVDGQPSLLSTILILSAMQYLNLVSVEMLLDASGIWRGEISRSMHVVTLVVLAGVNYAYSRRLRPAVASASRNARWTSAGMLYVFASIVALVGAAIYMNSVYSR